MKKLALSVTLAITAITLHACGDHPEHEHASAPVDIKEADAECREILEFILAQENNLKADDLFKRRDTILARGTLTDKCKIVLSLLELHISEHIKRKDTGLM